MSIGGQNASGHHSIPHLQGQLPDRYYHQRPVTSDWDVQPQFPAPYGGPIHQQQAYSYGTPHAHAADATHHHHALISGQQGRNFPANSVNSAHRGYENGVYSHPQGQQLYQGHVHPTTARHQIVQSPPVSFAQRPPSMHVDATGQRFEDRLPQGRTEEPRFIAGLHQQVNIRPSPLQLGHERPRSSYAPAPTNPPPLMRNPHQQQFFQSGADDVVDVEGSQRFYQPHHPFQDRQRPNTSPQHAVHPGQMHPHGDDVEDEPQTCGVGIVFHSSGHGSLAVKRLVPGGPAARCGLIKQGDILTHIDETNVYQQIASDINHLISGPQGSFVTLRFKRSGSSPVVAAVERAWAPSTAERSKALSNGGGPPSKISALLWLGDSSNSRDLGWLTENKVSFILNCAAECANHHTEKLHYLHLRLLDKPEESIRRAFEPALTFLQNAHADGQVVYVHCAAGRSRSATLVIAYIMKSRRMSLRNAIYAVRLARPMIKPNIGFFQQLCRYEKDLLGSKSCDMSDFSEFFKS